MTQKKIEDRVPDFNIAALARAEGNAAQARADAYTRRLAEGNAAPRKGGTHGTEKNSTDAAHRDTATVRDEAGGHSGPPRADLTAYLAGKVQKRPEDVARKAQSLVTKPRVKAPQRGRGKKS